MDGATREMGGREGRGSGVEERVVDHVRVRIESEDGGVLSAPKDGDKQTVSRQIRARSDKMQKIDVAVDQKGKACTS